MVKKAIAREESSSTGQLRKQLAQFEWVPEEYLLAEMLVTLPKPDTTTSRIQKGIKFTYDSEGK